MAVGPAETRLASATADVQWCWDRRTVTDTSVVDQADPVDYDTGRRLDLADLLFLGFKLDEVSTPEQAALTRTGQSVDFELTARYRFCWSATELVSQALTALQVVRAAKIIGPALGKLVKALPDARVLLTEVMKLAEELAEKMRGNVLLERLLGALKSLGLIGTIVQFFFDGSDDERGGFLEFIRGAASFDVTLVAGDGTKQAVPVGQALKTLLEQVPGQEDVQLFRDALDCGQVPLDWIREKFADAEGSTTLRLFQDGTDAGGDQAFGPFGFFDWFQRFAWLVSFSDLFAPNDALDWTAVPPASVEEHYRTCDWTALRPGDAPVPPPAVEGFPTVTACTDPLARR